MTTGAIHELADELRPRYLQSDRKGRMMILDEFCGITHYHRKAAIRLMNRRPALGQTSGKGRGRPREYGGGELVSALLLLWEASGFVCSKYMPAALPVLISKEEQVGKLLLTTDLRNKLLRMSAATVDRLLKPHRYRRLGQPHVSVRNPSDLSHRIAVHTFADLRKLPVGHVEVDLVLHCGMTTLGFSLTTLVAVDTLSSWTECMPVWGKGKERVAGSVARLRRQLPFPLRGIHSDNGSEFINDTLYNYCQRNSVLFTHSRPYHKNDQPRVEQRNNSLVRHIVGYQRYTSRQAFEQLELVYRLACTHANFFRPTSKLLSRERVGSRITKHYDAPLSPYQRLMASGQLTQDEQQHLREQYEQLDPLSLQRELGLAVAKLWTLETPDPVSERAQRLRKSISDALDPVTD